MGVVSEDFWMCIAKVVLDRKKTYSLSAISLNSGVNSHDCRRILDEMQRAKLIHIFKLSNQTVVECNFSSIKQVKVVYDAYIKKYHIR
jgi:hypothetical protein